MGKYNRTFDHSKPHPRLDTHPRRQLTPRPGTQGHGRTHGRSNRVSPAWYVIFLAALAALASTALGH